MSDDPNAMDPEMIKHFQPGSMPKAHGVEIIRNIARCTKCNSTIESKHVHDMVWCLCRKIAVDGGTEYLKRSGDFAYLEDLSEVIESWV